jgi:hypothetical protein
MFSLKVFMIGLILMIVLGSIVVYSLDSASWMIGTRGSVSSVGVSVWEDPGRTAHLTFIDWGALEPGQTKNRTAWIENNGTASLTLTLTTDSWNPEASTQYLGLSWDYTNQTIMKDEMIVVNMALTVSPEISGIDQFDFNIVIAGIPL